MITLNGGVSFWHRAIGTQVTREALAGDATVDVCVVGAGMAGLWTAYYLKLADPQLKIIVVEQEHVGFGASGRNAGNLAAVIPGSRAKIATRHGDAMVQKLQADFDDTVDEVISVAAGIPGGVDLHKGGSIDVAEVPAHLQRLEAQLTAAQRWGERASRLSAEQVSERIAFSGVIGGLYRENAAKLDPAKLVVGLALLVEGLGVRIFENTRALEIAPRRVVTGSGTVKAGMVVRATEGYGADLPRSRRDLLPLNSSILVTEELDESTWESIGWNNFESIGSYPHQLWYALRTKDNRIAFGGRGVAYRFGSAFEKRGETPQKVIDELTGILRSKLPQVGSVGIEQAWSGVLGVPRDWAPRIRCDREAGFATAGGFIGYGVSTSNLCGRILAAQITGTRDDILENPWVDRAPAVWEPEPLRWLGVASVHAAYRLADKHERVTRTTSPIAKIADFIVGR